MSDVDNFLKYILIACAAFITLSSVMTAYMILRRVFSNRSKLKKQVLIEKYQDFLSQFLVIPIDSSVIGQLKEQPTIRLNKKDIRNKRCRLLLLNELVLLRSQLRGYQVDQLVNYFYGLGLQEDVIRLIKSKSWTRKTTGIDLAKSFQIREAIPVINKFIHHKNRDLSISAIVARISFDRNLSVLEEINHKLNGWEWHKLYKEFKDSSIVNIESLASEKLQIQNESNISVVQKGLASKISQFEEHTIF